MSSLAPLLAAVRTAVELSEAASEASTAAAMATIQAKAALATVKLVIDLEAQRVTTLSGQGSKEASTSTEDLSCIEMETEAKETLILREEHDDELTDRRGDYIRYSRDALLLLQRHPCAGQPPIGIANEECVQKSLNHSAFHAQDAPVCTRCKKCIFHLNRARTTWGAARVTSGRARTWATTTSS